MTAHEDAAASHPSDEWIKLNVGGKIFTTTRTTLCTNEPNSMLARMFSQHQLGATTINLSVQRSSEATNTSPPAAQTPPTATPLATTNIASRHTISLRPSPKDEHGAYLIDRSSRYFEPILNYLRHGKLIIDHDINVQGVLEEAKFYGIVSLLPQLELETERWFKRRHQDLVRTSSHHHHLGFNHNQHHPPQNHSHHLHHNHQPTCHHIHDSYRTNHLNHDHQIQHNHHHNNNNNNNNHLPQAVNASAAQQASSLPSHAPNNRQQHAASEGLCGSNHQYKMNTSPHHNFQFNNPNPNIIGNQPEPPPANEGQCDCCRAPAASCCASVGYGGGGAALQTLPPLNRHDVIKAIMQTTSNHRGLRFQGCNLAGANLSKLDLRHINFRYANLRNANLKGANISGANFERADLYQSNLEGTQLIGTNLAFANLENSNLRAITVMPDDGDGHNANGLSPHFNRVSLDQLDQQQIIYPQNDSSRASMHLRANFECANLRNTNLEGSRLAESNLRMAILRGSNIQNCDLTRAILIGADLENCDLSGSNLNEANLRKANVKGAQFELEVL